MFDNASILKKLHFSYEHILIDLVWLSRVYQFSALTFSKNTLWSDISSEEKLFWVGEFFSLIYVNKFKYWYAFPKKLSGGILFTIPSCKPMKVFFCKLLFIICYQQQNFLSGEQNRGKIYFLHIIDLSPPLKIR